MKLAMKNHNLSLIVVRLCFFFIFSILLKLNLSIFYSLPISSDTLRELLVGTGTDCFFETFGNKTEGFTPN
jgi:hypothetical protein